MSSVLDSVGIRISRGIGADSRVGKKHILGSWKKNFYLKSSSLALLHVVTDHPGATPRANPKRKARTAPCRNLYR